MLAQARGQHQVKTGVPASCKASAKAVEEISKGVLSMRRAEGRGPRCRYYLRKCRGYHEPF